MDRQWPNYRPTAAAVLDHPSEKKLGLCPLLLFCGTTDMEDDHSGNNTRMKKARTREWGCYELLTLFFRKF